MRLSKDEVVNILRGLNELKLLSQQYQLFLYGSRADPNKRGGDIDLLLVVSSEILDQAKQMKHVILTQAKKYIDDQRVDILIHSAESSASDVFVNEIRKQLVQLK